MIVEKWNIDDSHGQKQTQTNKQMEAESFKNIEMENVVSSFFFDPLELLFQLHSINSLWKVI